MFDFARYSRDSILVCDVGSLNVVDKHPLGKITRWQNEKDKLVVTFNDYLYASFAPIRVPVVVQANRS